LPALAIFLTFVYYPSLFVVYLSFTNADLIRLPRWVGTANYSALFADATFVRSLEVTATFGLSVTGLETLLGVALGFLMHLRSRFSGLLQAVVFAPVVLPLTVTAIAWGYLVNPGSGAINRLLERAGVPTLGWLQDPGLALPTLVLITVWKGVGLPAVLYLAGLKQIPGELLEAAQVDGATPSQTTWRVTIPLLGPTTVLVVFLSLVNTVQSYVLVLLMTQGGPLGRTHLIGYFIYQQAFQFFHMGYAAAASCVLFGLLLGLGWLQLRITERRVHYA